MDIGNRNDCGGGHSHSSTCDAVYAVVAFAVVDWILIGVTFFSLAWRVFEARRRAEREAKVTPDVVDSTNYVMSEE